MSKHLLLALTPHGYGHAAMTAPVIRALRKRLPNLRLTIQTTIMREWLATRYDEPFDIINEIPDFGMSMHSASEVDSAGSATLYRDMHRNRPALLAREVERLKALKPDLLLANVPFLMLAAAQEAGIPAVALSSLAWGEIYRHYCRDYPECEEIFKEIQSDYAKALVFLRARPAMPMALPNLRDIGPLAEIGANRKYELYHRLNIGPGERLALIALGGIATALNLKKWPQINGWRFIIDPIWQAPANSQFISQEKALMPFKDILSSVDCLIGKPGYGLFAEAACLGLPVIVRERPDWPETSALIAWLSAHGRCQTVSADDWDNGIIAQPLQSVTSLPAPPPVLATGGDDAADILAEYLGR